jgi:hypothetical protein
MSKLRAARVVTAADASEMPLSAQIREALGELVEAAREGLMALSVGLGLGVVHELTRAEVDEVVGRRAITTATARRSATGTRTGR